MISMWKIYIYPFWMFELVEKYLEKMEHCGFRVEKIYLGFLFKFKLAQSKAVRFVCSRSLMKDNEMHLYEYEIRHKYNATEVPVLGLGEMRVHRICISNVDLVSFVAKRNKYTKKLIINRIIFISICLIGSICATLAYSKSVLWFSFISFFLVVALIYHLIGYVDLRRM